LPIPFGCHNARVFSDQVQVETTSLFRFVLQDTRIGVLTGGHEPGFCVKTIFLPLFFDFPLLIRKNRCRSEISRSSGCFSLPTADL